MADRAFVLLPGQGRLIDLNEFEMQVKADAASTGGVVSVLEATEPPGFGSPIHVHHDAAEAFYVLEASTSWTWTARGFGVPPARSSPSLSV